MHNRRNTDHCTVFIGEIVCNPVQTAGGNPLGTNHIIVFMLMSFINVLLSIKLVSDEKENCGRNDYVLIFIEIIHQFLKKTTQEHV